MWNVKQKKLLKNLNCVFCLTFSLLLHTIGFHLNTLCSYQHIFRHCLYCIEPSSYTSQDAGEIVKVSEIRINGNVTKIWV